MMFAVGSVATAAANPRAAGSGSEGIAVLPKDAKIEDQNGP